MSYATVLRRLIRDRDHVVAALKRLDDRTLEDLVRRGQHVAGGDGYGGSSFGDGGSPSANTDTSVEAAAASRAESHLRDSVAKSLHEIAGLLGVMRDIAIEVDQRHQGIVNARPSEDRENSTLGCAACGRTVLGTRDDRLRSGYCASCYTAWLRTGRPDRVAFERNRPKVDNRAVDTCIEGHRCCVRRGVAGAGHTHWRPPSECADCRALLAS